MFIIFSLDSILLVLAVMTLLGIGWAAMILTWIWEHAVIIGIILLILHIIINLGHTMIAAENYAGLGIICSVIHGHCSASFGYEGLFDIFLFSNEF